MKILGLLLCLHLLAGCAGTQVRPSGQWDIGIGAGNAHYSSLGQRYPSTPRSAHGYAGNSGWWPRFDMGWLFDAPLQPYNPSRMYLNGSRYARYPLPRPGYPFLPPPPLPGPVPFER